MDADKQVVFANRRELIDKIYETERRDYVRFVHRRTNGQTEASEELKTLIKKRIRFEDVKHPRSRHLSITNDQIPFVILKAEVWECSQGPSHRPSSSKQVNLSDHSYGDKTKRKVQRSKKKRCPVQIRARHIVKFPEYKIDGVCTARRKREISAQLRREFNLDTIQQHVILAELPSTESHKNHSIGEIAGHTEPLDWSVKEKIKSLCLSGHRNIRSIQLSVQNFVKEKLGEQTSSRRFTPTTADIRSHVYHAVVGTRLQSAEQDQSDVQSLVHRWQETYPKDNFFFRPSSLAEDNIEPLLFVCQTEFQRGLLQRYRSEMVLMDATYNFSNYNIPMYNLCIPTNVGYYVVASFITSVDRTLNVMEGLDFIKGWNPQWKPKHFIVDFDLREIEALEKTFAGVKVFLCDFHRSQAWQRWLTKNRIPDKNEVLASLSKVANADNEEILQEAMASIRNSVIYQENVTFRNWWEKKWIAEKERWVFLYRGNIINTISTTNGLERQYSIIKKDYLSNFCTGKSLKSVLTVLVERYFKDSEARYRRANAAMKEQWREYNEDLPTWLKNRPKRFLDHCLRRIPPQVNSFREENVSADEDNRYTITSPDSGNTYVLLLNEENPKCSCLDFQKIKWPCKHLLGFIFLYGMKGCLKDYFSRPIFSIDDSVLNTTYIDNYTSISNLQNCPEKSQEGVTEQVALKSCLSVLKSIESGLYNIAGSDIFQDIHVLPKLKEIESHIDGNTFKIAGLPMKNTKKMKRRKIQAKTTNPTVSLNLYSTDNQPSVRNQNLTNTDVNNPKTVMVTISDAPCLPEDFDLNRYPDICEDVKKIWKMEKEIPPHQIGPYTLTTTSIQCINTLLSDEVIDAFLHQMIQQHHSRRIYHLNCITLTAILEGMTDIHHNLRRMPSLMTYDMIIGAYNQGRCHWCLVRN